MGNTRTKCGRSFAGRTNKIKNFKERVWKKKDEFKGSLTKNIIDRYGGEEHLDAPPKSLLMAQTEDYIEYSRQGKIIKVNKK